MTTSLEHVREYLQWYTAGETSQNEYFRDLSDAILCHGVEAVFSELPPDVVHDYRKWVDSVYTELLEVPPGTHLFIGSNITQRENDHRCRLVREVEPILRNWFEAHGSAQDG